MIPLLKSEFRKLLSIRSTYLALLLSLMVIVIMAFWVRGYQAPADITAHLAETTNTKAYESIFIDSAMLAGGFAGLAIILYMAHEYRYNLIMYTLVSSNSRTKVLLSKIIVTVVYGAVFTILCGFTGILLYRLGLSLRGGVVLPAQTIDWVNISGRILFYNIGQMLLALIFTTLSRSIAAALAIVFIFPSAIEPLLSILLKEKAAYLPYAVYERIVSGFQGEAAQLVPGTMSVSRALLVASLYLVVGWAITWLVFIKRDAN